MRSENITLEITAFQGKLNESPPTEFILKTEDGQGNCLPIAYLEGKMDELFEGQWGTENFVRSRFKDKLDGSVEVWGIHPVTGVKLNHVGAFTFDISAKKSNDPDLPDLNFPSLLAHCIKNGVRKFGRVLGRELNREKEVEVLSLSPEKYKEVKEAILTGKLSEDDINGLEDLLKTEFKQRDELQKLWDKRK